LRSGADGKTLWPTGAFTGPKLADLRLQRRASGGFPPDAATNDLTHADVSYPAITTKIRRTSPSSTHEQPAINALPDISRPKATSTNVLMRPVLLLLVFCLIIIAFAVLGAIRLSEARLRAEAEIDPAESLVGNYYTFRPYFQNAIAGNEARYYAVGVTTGEAGYYFAQPVRNENQIVGVAVLKLELESLQEQWQQKKPHSLLIDDEGIIIVSSNPQWRYQATRALSEQDHERYQKQQKYANYALRLLDTRGSFDDRRIRIDGQTYLNSKASLPLQQWTLVQLTPVTTIYNTGIITALFSALLASLSIALFLYRREPPWVRCQQPSRTKLTSRFQQLEPLAQARNSCLNATDSMKLTRI